MSLRATIIVAALLSSTTPIAADALPRSSFTPGAIASQDPTLVCARGYARKARHRYDAEWRRYRVAIFHEYGIPHTSWRDYTVDHLIPIELGGKPFGTIGDGWDLRNVWPEPKAEAERKDAVENALHAAVCYRSGYRGIHLSLDAAQRAIAHDWMHTPVGLPWPRD
jgi:hypothetical protein